MNGKSNRAADLGIRDIGHFCRFSAKDGNAPRSGVRWGRQPTQPWSFPSANTNDGLRRNLTLVWISAPRAVSVLIATEK